LAEVSESIRLLLIAAPGHDLICSDYSAIEAVVLAALAGEEWRLEVFRTHGKIYEMSVAMITGIPFEEITEHKTRTGEHHALRNSLGKIAELASGYRGWVNAWKRFGAADHFPDDASIKNAILKWRAASPAIVEFWGGQWREVAPWTFAPCCYGLEGAAVQAVLNPGAWYSHRAISYALNPATGVLHCRLPSGRDLYYHEARLTDDVDRFSRQPIKKILFTGADKKTGKPSVQSTHGGVLTENVVQAASRDLLAEAMLRIDAAGYPIVAHVHDEVIAEVPEGWGDVSEFETLMATRPAWAHDWPIRAAGGWRGKRYKK
jgi:DNA polymerase